ncbi:MAG: glycosyltransferase family 9 protein [Bacteroidetes bacterium]|nr:glycosyltransferase family 9 protein [Bacteroidota bacterium]MBS1649905.1 glycosyltransferase family 9 protein [Bacteroidota bacterium]
MKILIIRFSSIGDIVLTTPAIRCLKQQINNVSVHYLTKENYASILTSNPYIDKVITLNNDWSLMIAELKKEQYDYIIDLHHNLRTLKVKRALKKVKSFSFNKLNIQKWLLTAFKINILPTEHIVDRYMNTLKKMNVFNDGQGLDFFIPEKDKVALKDIPASHHFGFIGIVIGAALNTKKLPLSKLKELCAKINHPIILLGGKEDREIGDDIMTIDNIKIYNACGKFNLNESADLIRQSKCIITHDTGLMHIAAALKKKIISVWGNTIPEFGMTPYYGNNQIQNIIFQVSNLSCRPCSKIGYHKCPKKHFKCMQLQNVERIAKNTIELIK